MAWNLAGRFLESCSCKVLCPCWFGPQELMDMDEGWCGSAWLIEVEEGSSGGVDLSGTTALIASHFPGPTIYDGGGTARVHLDDGATEEQRRELDAILRGTKGGPMELLGSFVSTWLPTRASRIDVQEEGDAVTAEVEGFGEFGSRVLRDEEGRAMTLANAGFASGLGFEDRSFQVAPSESRWSDPELPRSFETRSGAVARFRWEGA